MSKDYVRKFRERDEVTKMKIGNSLRNRAKSAEHCRAISQGLKNYGNNIAVNPKFVGQLLYYCLY